MYSFILDLTTVSALLVLIAAFLTFVMVFVWFTQKTYKGFGLWVIANFAVAIGMILLGIQTIWADLVGTSLTFAAVLIAYEGIRQFLQLRHNLFFSVGVLVIHLIAHICFKFFAENLIWQVSFSSLLAGILTGLCGWFLIRTSEERKKVSHKLAALTYFIFALIMISRSAFKVYTFDDVEIYTLNAVQSIFFVVYILFQIACTFNYINLNANRLQDELKETQEELKQLATTDFLTQINNRRKFLEIGEHEIKRAMRFRYPLSLIMFDIDHFKLVNDNYGHLAGDKVLVKTVEVSKQTLRNTDTIGRLGGEEFGVILPHTKIAGARTVAECLRVVIEETNLEFANKSISFTASFGVTELKGTDNEMKDILERVDRLMYQAKNEGRNRVASDAEKKKTEELILA